MKRMIPKTIAGIAVLWVAVTIFAPFSASGVQPTHNFSDRTVPELLSLLESTDPQVRQCAAIFIGDRYRNPEAIVIDAPRHKPNSPAPEYPIPNRVIPALTTHLKTDADRSVRVCALEALCNLRYHTNTTPIVALALNDKDTLMRINACTALINISHDYSETLHTQAIPTLIGCLDPKGEIEQVWQAAYAAEQLGTNGTAVVPALRTLTTHDSPKVRYYAERALSRIQPVAIWKPGQQPKHPSTQPDAILQRYVVRKGDTLSMIARSSGGDTVAEIVKRNGIQNPDRIVVGQVLYVRQSK